MTPTVLSLRCPPCGGPLRGAQQDVVFWCGACGAAHEVVGGRFVGRPARRAVPPGGRGPVLYLPLWAFPVRYACRWKDPEREALARHLPPLERVFVTGFALHNPSYFGDPGLIYTQKRVILSAAAGPAGGTPVVGCSRGLEEARAFVEPHILTIIDRRVDVTGLELECTPGEATLWGVPYVDLGADLRDGLLGLRLPAAAVEAVEEIRAGQDQGRA